MISRIYRIARPEHVLEGEVQVEPVWGHGREIGNSLAHLNAALVALREGVFPCVVLEEDACWIHRDIPFTCESPWMWIGVSKFILNEKNRGCWSETFPSVTKEGIVEMGRMLATHGLVYYSAEGALRMVEASVTGVLDRKMPIDVAVVIKCSGEGWSRPGLASPAVYQRGENEMATRFSIPG